MFIHSINPNQASFLVFSIKFNSFWVESVTRIIGSLLQSLCNIWIVGSLVLFIRLKLNQLLRLRILLHDCFWMFVQRRMHPVSRSEDRRGGGGRDAGGRRGGRRDGRHDGSSGLSSLALNLLTYYWLQIRLCIHKINC